MSDRTKAFLEGTQAQQIAILTLQGDSETAIAEQLGLTPNRVKALKRNDEFWKHMEEEAKHTAETLRVRFRRKLEGAEKHAWDTFIYHLKEKKTLEAVRMYAEFIGLKAKESTENDTPAVTILMPGSQQTVEKVIEVQNDQPQGTQPQPVPGGSRDGGESGNSAL